MIDMNEFFELIESGAIDTYRGETTVLRDLSTGLFVIGQGDRILVLSDQQTLDLVRVLMSKLEGVL